jgi:CDP-6-deoxy-D-xylo-4-hexulose-3-dehydrase
MKSRYPLASTTFGQEEIEAAKAVLDSQQFTMGARVQKFESEFAQWLGAKHALMVNSGSSANLLMVEAMLRRSKKSSDWKLGDEVLVPALAWPTTVWPLIQLGLVPVFVDVDPKTLAIDIESAKSVLTPKTKGMMLIHVLGQAADMTAIMGFCESHGIQLLEDNCESLGSFFKGQASGTFGKMGSFSCFFSHHISTMEGGMITTNDSELYDDLKSIRAHGWVRDRSDKDEWLKKYPELDPRFMFIMAGYNVRPMEIQAAIGSVQLAKLDGMLAGRDQLALHVQSLAQKNSPWMKLLGSEHLGQKITQRSERRHSWMTFPFVVDSKSPLQVEQVKSVFEKCGVETRPIIAGNLAKHPAAQTFKIRSARSLSQCDEILSRGFMIGCHPVLQSDSKNALDEAFLELSKF